MRKIRNFAFVLLVAIAAVALKTEPVRASGGYDICSEILGCGELLDRCNNTCQGPPVFYGANWSETYCFTEPNPYDEGDWTCVYCVCQIEP